MNANARNLASGRPNRSALSPAVALLILSVATAVGCAPAQPASTPSRPKRTVSVKTDAGQKVSPPAQTMPAAKVAVSDDACPKALHELCGSLLLYFAAHRQLPADLQALRDLAGETEPSLAIACPKTGQPYIYRPDSPLRDAQGGRIILYDASPAHGQNRWAVTIQEPLPGKPLTTKVIAIPEPQFLKWQAAAGPRLR